MRVIYVDIDTLRPDHLGCYGYGRNTSPCIDSIAGDGIRFNKYYTPNAPCLPSRACLNTGMYGIHTGIVGHGGTAADMRLQGYSRGFKDRTSENSLFNVFRKAGMHTVSISTFAERHSSWWFNAGFKEVHNFGKSGNEIAAEVTPIAEKWLNENAETDNWFMHFHIWDPHTPYRTPEDFGNPFENEPLCDDWITDEIFEEHLNHVGPHSCREIGMFNSDMNPNFPKHLGELKDKKDLKFFMDQYDCGIRYADDNLAKLIKILKEKGVYEDTAIMISSDHGENMGELGLYAEHATADEPCCHIPMIIKWPGVKPSTDDSLHLNLDLAPTMAEMLNVVPSPDWDGKSYAKVLRGEKDEGYECVVVSQCAHVCQRSARFGDYIYIRTVHGGLHLFDDEMLFNIKEDPHQLNNLVNELPDVVAKGAKYILDWEYDMMKKSKYDTDPMWTVMREDGPLHSRGYFDEYVERLQNTGRAEGAELLKKKYPNAI